MFLLTYLDLLTNTNLRQQIYLAWTLAALTLIAMCRVDFVLRRHLLGDGSDEEGMTSSTSKTWLRWLALHPI